MALFWRVSILPIFLVLTILCNDVFSQSDLASSELQTRLPNDTFGLVEVRRGNETSWGSLCSKELTSNEANVVCRSLNFRWGQLIEAEGNSTELWWDSLSCAGDEVSLKQCRHSTWGADANCTGKTLLAVKCFNTSVRYESSSSSDAGYGYIQFMDKFGKANSVCNNNWDNLDAQVACKEMGFNTGRAVNNLWVNSSKITEGTVWEPSLGNFICNGSETSLQNCFYSSRTYSCTGGKAMVACFMDALEFQNLAVKLVDGDTNWGRVQLKYMGIWSTLCDLHLGENFSRPICRILGFKNGSQIGKVRVANSKALALPTAVLTAKCIGNETSVDQCSGYSTANSPLVHLCKDHKTDYFVHCHDDDGIQFRLAGPDWRSPPRFGRVEVRVDGVWGTICNNLWNTTEATVLCKHLGFTDGVGYKDLVYSEPSAPSKVWLAGIECDNKYNTLTRCMTSGWGIYNAATSEYCSSHEHDASVACSMRTRLVGGRQPHYGRVEIYSKNNWRQICGTGFDDEDAKVVCRELGYENAINMCCHAFGHLKSAMSDGKAFKCSGNETELAECTTVAQTYCRGLPSNYASVYCYNDTLSQDVDIILNYKQKMSKNNTLGLVQVRFGELIGHVCGDDFTDVDANVTCRELGMTGGIPYKFSEPAEGPVLMSHVNCTGSESTLRECLHTNWTSDYCSSAAGVLCYKDEPVKVSLKPVLSNSSGFVQIHHEGILGFICVMQLTSREAAVLCRQMGYVDGTPLYMRNNLTSSSSFFLRNIQCSGMESSIFQCLNDGWREKVDGGCNLPGYRVASVKCSGAVRLEAVHQNNVSEIGRVQVYSGSSWKNLCIDKFTDFQARLVCLEMHFSYAEIVQPFYFTNFMGYIPVTTSATDVFCDGQEGSLSECRQAPRVSCVVATVVCSQQPISNKTAVEFDEPVKNKTHGMISLKRFGYPGRACATNWNDNAANVACRQMGFTGGVMQKSRSYSRDVNWLLNYKCRGNETDLSDCPSTGRKGNCVSSQIVGAICFNENDTAPTFRLVNTNMTSGQIPTQGYVEVTYNGEVGSICDYGWSRFDARVLCRQIGFYDGEKLYGAHPGAPEKKFMSNLDCMGKESHILECPFSGWDVPDSHCMRGSTAGVKCHDKVRLDLGQNSGPVELNLNGRWGYICDDNWTQKEALVTCQQVGFRHGRPACCSLYGRRFYHSFVARKVNCTGHEKKLQNCTMETSLYQTCKSGHYASVVCWDDGAAPEYGNVRFEPISLSSSSEGRRPAPTAPGLSGPLTKGRIQVEFGGTYGYICGSETWDDNAATVFCRQKGIGKKGSAYRSAAVTSRLPFWITSFNCTGDEPNIMKCQNTTWTNLTTCDQNYVASAICIDDKIEFRLGGGNNESYGRVEVAVDNEWGTVCDYHWSTQEADVICRHLDFHSGVPYTNSYYGPGTGKVWLFGLECTGNETSLTQCPHEGWDSLNNGYSNSWYCRGHFDDAGVYCYGHVRLQKGEDLSYGRLELLDKANDTWYPVCDDGSSEDSYSDIVCKQLGYVSGQSFCCSSFGNLAKMSTALVNLTCKGDEADIRNCSYSIGSCPSKKYVSLMCSNETASKSENLSVSLMNPNPSIAHNGMVRVTVREAFTGRICSRNWTDANANVTCKMLGYAGGAAYQFRSQSRLMFVMSHVNCTGLEDSLAECSYSKVGEDPGCMITDHDAGVLCYNTTGISYSLSEGDYGVVNITVDDVSGHVCHLGWGDTEARILCRQMGHIDGSAYVVDDNSYYSQKRWMTSLYCDGDEPSLFNCQDSGWDNVPYYCISTASVAAVYCYGKVRLQRPNAPSAQLPTAGAVVIHDGGKWNLICDEQWDANDAKVACRSLGFADGLPVCCSAYGFISYKYKFTRFNCNGTENSLDACPNDTIRFSSIENTACRHASVVCLKQEQSKVTDYSLQLGRQAVSDRNTGKVMVRYASELGRICSDGWTDEDARVVCAELGYNLGQSYRHFDTYSDNLDNYGPWWTSNVKCLGNETRFGDCQKDDWGKVTKCSSRNAAGVLCYSFDEPTFRLSDGNGPNYGLVEVAVDGEWGTICDISWDSKEARVFCRMMGFADGQASSRYGRGTGPIWMSGLQCSGNETRLTGCVHTGWKRETRSSCIYHYRDAGVYCFKQVRLYDGSSTSLQMQVRAGAVLFYSQDTEKWSLVCDDHHNPDLTAKMACQEMNYVDGRAVHSSAYSPIREYDILNGTLRCTGNEASIKECYTSLEGGCSSGLYMSVICLDSNTYDDTVYNVSLPDDTQSGIVNVEYMGQPALICADDWDDNDAKVLCKSLAHEDGIAYYHSTEKVPSSTAGRIHKPYVLKSFNCTGDENDLMDCPHESHETLGNCTARHAAGVFCFKYDAADVGWRLEGGPTPEQGRVEMRLGDVWGSVCDAYWDDMDARVLCRQLNYEDGEAFGGAKFGPGNGTVWISQIQCDGDEDDLLQCPIRGFNTSSSEGPVLRWNSDARGSSNWPSFKYCHHHKNDASVFCFGSVKLSNGANASYGAVQVYKDHKLHIICDDHWTDKEAKVVCKALGFVDGRAIPKSAFGHLNNTLIGLRNVTCKGDEGSLLDCNIHWENKCPSAMYASVYCSNKTITKIEPSLQLVNDTRSSKAHGIIQVNLHGLWGRVCRDNFGEKEANVTCRMLGYRGGVPYMHIASDKRPFTMSNVICKGNESSLFDCSYQEWSSPNVCKKLTTEAGVLCYNSSGINYQLAGGESNSSQGRAEIQYDGVWGTVCNLAFSASDARVFCSALGFKDGQVVFPNSFGPGSGPVWLETLSCTGNETNPLHCLSSGWNSSWESFSFYQCSGHNRDAAVECYPNIMELNQVRLAGGSSNYSGRVEVFVTEANQWGTVCDDGFDAMDAQVLCRMMGLAGGKHLSNAAFGEGSGPIWLDDMMCKGNETHISECKHPGLGHTNCFHFEDVAIECESPSAVSPVTVNPSSTPVPLTTLPHHLRSKSTPATTRPNLPISIGSSPMITSPSATPPSSTKRHMKTPSSTVLPSTTVSTSSAGSTGSTQFTTTKVTPSPTSTRITKPSKPSKPTSTTTSTATSTRLAMPPSPASTPASTTESSTAYSTSTEGAQPAAKSTSNSKLIAAIVVPILIVIITVAVLVLVFLRFRDKKVPRMAFANLGEPPMSMTSQDTPYQYTNQLYNYLPSSIDDDGLSFMNNNEDAQLTQNEVPPAQEKVVDPLDVKLKGLTPATDDSQA